MPIMNSAAFADVVEPILNEAFDGVYTQATPEWSEVFETRKGTPRRFHEEPVLYGFEAAPEKGEGAEILEDSGGIAYRTRYVYKTYAISFALTEELIEDGEHMSMGALYSRHMATAMTESKELVHADVFNRAETSGYELGDGVTMLNTAHPLAGGGTFANTLAVAADLSEAALEDLLILQGKAVDERGNRIRLRTKKIVVPVDLQFVAHRLLNSINQAGTANNDINAIRSMSVIPSAPCVMSRLTLAKSYFLITDAPHGFSHFPRAKIKRAMEGDFKTGNMRYKARERYTAGVGDPRAVYGDLGL
jgi:hypothetical protein